MAYGPECSICGKTRGRPKPEVAAIDELLMDYKRGLVSFRDFDPKLSRKPEIAQRFNLSKDAIRHHAHACLGLTADKRLVDAARKRNERSAANRIIAAGVALPQISLRTPEDHEELDERNYATIELVRLQAMATANSRELIAAVETLQRIKSENARRKWEKAATSLVVDARTINIQGASADFMREYVAAVRRGDPVPSFPPNTTIEAATEGEIVAA